MITIQHGLRPDTYAAERDRQDDMVLSIALACWHREYMDTHLERANAD